MAEKRSHGKQKSKLSKGTRVLLIIVLVIVAIALLLGVAVLLLDRVGQGRLTDDGSGMTAVEEADVESAGRVRYKGQL